MKPNIYKTITTQREPIQQYFKPTASFTYLGTGSNEPNKISHSVLSFPLPGKDQKQQHYPQSSVQCIVLLEDLEPAFSEDEILTSTFLHK